MGILVNLSQVIFSNRFVKHPVLEGVLSFYVILKSKTLTDSHMGSIGTSLAGLGTTEQHSIGMANDRWEVSRIANWPKKNSET